MTMTGRWLHLRLTAPFMAFGGVAVDHVGPTRSFPSASALTGLLANALGYRREDRALHQSLQDRLIFGALSVTSENRVMDIQNARLEKADAGWTTLGQPEGRTGDSYEAPHRRHRIYLADHETRVVLRLKAACDPTLDRVADAIDRPVRPLFIGRKSCIPSSQLVYGWVVGDTAHDALRAIGIEGHGLWPADSGPCDSTEQTVLADLRNWQTGLHGGTRLVCNGRIA